jgi:Rap1a immunity proteins
MRRWIVPDAVLCCVGPGRSVVGSRRREVDVAALVNDDLKGNYMKLALLVCAAALSLVPSGRGAAGGSGTILTGNGLFSALAGCPKSDTSQSYGKALNHFTHEEFENCMVATGYIMGVVDALGLTPVSVTYGQDFEIIYAYLKNHLNQRQRPSLSLIRDALAEAFPPPKGK